MRFFSILLIVLTITNVELKRYNKVDSADEDLFDDDDSSLTSFDVGGGNVNFYDRQAGDQFQVFYEFVDVC